MNSSFDKHGNEQPSNSTDSLSTAFLLVIISTDFIFGFIVTTGNAALFITIFRDPCRCLRSSSVLFIANLSVADFLMGAVSYLRGVELIYQYHGVPEVPILNITQYFVGAVAILAAVSTLMAMSYERYVAVMTPFQYPQKMTANKTKIAITVIWTNALVLCVLPVSNVKRENFLLAYCYSHFVLPSFVLTAVYVKIYKQIASQREELRQVRASLTAANRRHQLEKERRMVIAFVLILFVFYCSFVPYFIYVHILFFCPCRSSAAFQVYRLIANEFLSVSSVVDPFMYAWRIPKFNRSLRLCFQQLKGQNAVGVWNGTTSILHQDYLTGQKEHRGTSKTYAPGTVRLARVQTGQSSFQGDVAG